MNRSNHSTRNNSANPSVVDFAFSTDYGEQFSRLVAVILSLVIIAGFSGITAASVADVKFNEDIPAVMSQQSTELTISPTIDVVPNTESAMQQETTGQTEVITSTQTTGGATVPNVDLQVNGQNIPVPAQGTHTQTVPSEETGSNVQLHIQNSTSNNDDSGTDTRVRIRSDVNSDVEVRTRSP